MIRLTPNLISNDLDNIRDDLSQSNIIYELEEKPGYINQDGSIGNPTANKEVYIGEIAIKQNDSFGLYLKYTLPRDMWIAYAIYDSEHVFLGRGIVTNTSNTQEYSGTVSTGNANAAYIAFTYRTYGEAKLTIYNNFMAKLTPLSGSLTSADDLNELQKPGFYITGYNNFPINYPAEIASGQGLVFVYPDRTSATPFLIQEFINVYTGITYYRTKAATASASWNTWNTKKWFTSLGSIDSNTDLNNLKSEGYYLTKYNNNPINSPSGALQGFVMVNRSETSPFAAQQFVDLYTGKLYVRLIISGTNWTAWRHASSITALGSLTSNDDLDDKQTEGYYITSYSSIPVNAPNNATQGLVFICVNSNTGTYPFVVQTYVEIYTGKIYSRSKAGTASATWGKWYTQEQGNWNESKTSKSFNEYEEENTSITPVAGDRVRVLSYNVAHYNNDTSTFIDELHEKLINFKKLLMFVNADIIATPEDNEFINSASTKDSTTWLYKPIYPFKVGGGSCCLHSKLQYTLTRNITLPSGSIVRMGAIPVGSKSLTVYSVHLPVSSAESRATTLSELFDQIATDNPEYYVIAGDMNTLENGEPETFKATCESHGCKLANGGYLGWLITHKNDLTIDNIVVSSNIIIENTIVLSNWFEDLYSDHFPMYCDLVLLG